METDGRYLVLGTAGHIDHGKTTLVRALTGIDCDTLAEEKERGITIVLGFAHWDLPDGTRLGVVDVPGHKRFVRSMVAGAAGIHLVMLVIAADDGVMPQTREHLHIARLLGVQAGLVALTKCDLVDEETRELAVADVEDLLAGSFLEGCPIVPVSSTTGAGLEELTQTVTEIAACVKPQEAIGKFRMPIDRVFTVKGVGTVVTGTTLAGVVKVDDELELVPVGKRGRVRSIELHGQAVKSCGAGHRAALNLVGFEKNEIERGHVLAVPGSLPTTYMLDAEIELLADTARPLRRGSEAMLHAGTTEYTAKLFPLDCEVVAPGAPGLVQFRLNQPAALIAGDRFILRDSTSEYTIGGGTVLDAHPTKHRKKRQEAAEQLDGLRETDAAASLKHEIVKAPFALDSSVAAYRLHLSAEEIGRLIAVLTTGGEPVMTHGVGQQLYLTLPDNRRRIVEAVLKALSAHRAANPLVATGLSAKALVKTIDRQGAGVPVEVIAPALAEAVADGRLVSVGGTYALPRVEIKLSQRDEQAVELIEKALNASAQPDQPEDFQDSLPVDKKRMKQLLNYLEEQGRIVSQLGMYFGAEIIARAQRSLKRHFEKQDTVTVSEFRQMMGSSRKYTVPLIQYLDQSGMLVREGDVRKLNPEWESPSEE
ncbi:selenocysteine-specific translation elongation factor [bacterium]|nr:selenocysteine-specific translation elongation factor [bacterium]